ncbi:MAG: hypothetical protein PHS49_07915 [Candidatus Gracilibacteria bacterium]|nr:hypothetical protein [Candidatus Gracilibacteria bacterium]
MKFLQSKEELITKKIDGLFYIIPLKNLRHTNRVDFKAIPFFEDFNGIDIVNHEPGAMSPGQVEGQGSHWYMHPYQEDNLLTFQGNRFVELYTKEHGKVEKFEISNERILWNGELVYEGQAILGWPVNVFHRNYSPNGSISINLAYRTPGFDIDTEFNIYNLDTETGEYSVARIGKLDQ